MVTSVRVPLQDTGRRAMEMALASDAAEVVEVPTSVVLRESTPQR